MTEHGEILKRIDILKAKLVVLYDQLRAKGIVIPDMTGHDAYEKVLFLEYIEHELKIIGNVHVSFTTKQDITVCGIYTLDTDTHEPPSAFAMEHLLGHIEKTFQKDLESSVSNIPLLVIQDPKSGLN